MMTPQPLHPLSDPSPAPDRPRVLLIEDDPLQSRGLLRLLRLCEVEAHCVDTVAAALFAVASRPPYDVIICDQGLPDLPGEELAQRLRRPLLVSYSGQGRWPAWFDVGLCKPALRELLRLLRAPRLDVAITQIGAGTYFGICKQEDLRCQGQSPVQVLRQLASALDARGAQ